MVVSYKIRRLLLISIGIIILALAADGSVQSSKNTLQDSVHPAPRRGLDLDPKVLEAATPAVTPKTSTPAPQSRRSDISAEAYLVANLDTGEKYAEFNTGEVFPVASLSKLVTALVAIHDVPPEHTITITQPMLDAYGDAGHLILGETFSVAELLSPLLLESSNDAAEAIAQSYGYANFIAKMNAFIRKLGMSSTSFEDSSGLSPKNVSNSRDLLALARYLYAQEKNLLELTRQSTVLLASTTGHSSYIWKTINPFPHDTHFIGGKTGRTTEAKESMISLFKYEIGGVSYPIAIIVLRSDFSLREIDTALLVQRFIRKIEGR